MVSRRVVVEFENDQTQTNRSLPISDEPKRYIFTWNDMNHDGVVNYATGEVLDLEANPPSPSWNTLAKDFNAVDGYELNNIISWLRGKDWIYDEDLDGDGAWDVNETVDYDANDGPRPREPYRSRKTVESGTVNHLLGDSEILSIPPPRPSPLQLKVIILFTMIPLIGNLSPNINPGVM